MAGHLARNQVHAGSIPAAQTIESAAQWWATGPENRGGGDEPQRFDSSALSGPFSYQLGCRLFKAAKRGQHPHGLLLSRSSSRLEDAAFSQGGRRGFESRTRPQRPPAIGPRPATTNRRLWRFESPRGDTVLETTWMSVFRTGRAKTRADQSSRAFDSRRLSKRPSSQMGRRRIATPVRVGPIPTLASTRARCLRLHARLPVRGTGFDSRCALSLDYYSRFVPLSERLRTLPSKQESRVRLPGGTPRTACVDPEVPQGVARAARPLSPRAPRPGGEGGHGSAAKLGDLRP